MHEPVVPLYGRRFYVFGPFRLDPLNRLLLRDGRPLPLTAKVYDVLLYFVENSERLLTKDEILKSVWPDSFVEEGNLARHVSTLRKVLGEGPKDHAYIVTVAGRGYRFVAHVSTVTDRDGREPVNLRALEPRSDPVAALSSSVAAQGPPHRRWSKVVAVGLSAAAVAVAVLLAFQWFRPRSAAPGPVDPLRFAWRTNTGDVYGPAISRDGKYLAYIWLAPNGDQGVRLRQVAGGATIDVFPAGPDQYWGLRFSPNGEFIYYLIADRASQSVGTLYRVPKLGGRPERVLDNVNGHIAPSPDGQSVAVVRNNDAPGFAAILSVDQAGGPVRRLTRLEWPVVVQALEWAPDGRSLLCALKRRSAAGDRWHVIEVPSAGGSPVEILPPRSSQIITAAWLPERRGFLMTALDPDSGLPQVWRVSYPDGAERRLTDDLHNYKDLTVSADGRTAVAQSLGHLVQLWIAPGTDANQAKQIASATARGAFDALAWTTDSQLLFKWGERDSYDIWRMSPDGNNRRQLSVNARDIADTSVAPDGRFVFFTSTRGGSRQIWRMRPDGEDLRQLTHLKWLVSNPVAAADGHWVYFAAESRGFPTLWKMTVDGESVSEVSDRAIELFDLSPDGRRLAYSYRDLDRKCIRVAVEMLDGSAEPRQFDIEPTFALRWTPDGQGLAFTAREGNVRAQPVAGGSPSELTRVHPTFKVVSFDWSPDGRHLAYTLLANPVDAIAFNLR